MPPCMTEGFNCMKTLNTVETKKQEEFSLARWGTKPMLPIFLDMTDRLAVVIGGGRVGRRKASAVLSAGGRVRLVCLEPRPADMSDSRMEWRMESYSAEHLDDAELVFAAGPAELNARVLADARTRGVWVNATSEPASGDFYL